MSGRRADRGGGCRPAHIGLGRGPLLARVGHEVARGLQAAVEPHTPRSGRNSRPSRSSSKSTATAAWPIETVGWQMVVSGGAEYGAIGMSSNTDDGHVIRATEIS